MSTDNVKGEGNKNIDINWDALIEHSESQIAEHSKRIKELRKSLLYFKKQVSAGIPFPAQPDSRHKKIS
jgi:hypothetical protein